MLPTHNIAWQLGAHGFVVKAAALMTFAHVCKCRQDGCCVVLSQSSGTWLVLFIIGSSWLLVVTSKVHSEYLDTPAGHKCSKLASNEGYRVSGKNAFARI